MTRTPLGAANQAEVVKPVVRIAEFCELAFPGGTIRVTTADRDITWGGFNYVANPGLMDYGRISESSGLKSQPTSLRFSGLDSGLITRILTDNYHYARAQGYIGFFDENWALVGNPYPLVEELLMSSASVTLDSGTGVVEISCDGWELFGQRDSAVLATPESQRLRYAGDTGQDKIAFILTQNIEWGGIQTRVGDARAREGGGYQGGSRDAGGGGGFGGAGGGFGGVGGGDQDFGDFGRFG